MSANYIYFKYDFSEIVHDVDGVLYYNNIPHPRKIMSNYMLFASHVVCVCLSRYALHCDAKRKHFIGTSVRIFRMHHVN